MRRKIFAIPVMVALISVWSVCAWAMDKTDKVAFINMQVIIQNSEAGKKAVEELKKIYEKDAKEIKAAEEELKTMKEGLEKQDSGMSRESRSEKETAYQKKLRDYKLKAGDMEQEIKKRDQELIQKLMPGIMKAVRSIAEQEKYTMIIDVSTMPIPFYSQENDISTKVIEEFNKAE